MRKLVLIVFIIFLLSIGIVFGADDPCATGGNAVPGTTCSEEQFQCIPNEFDCGNGGTQSCNCQYDLNQILIECTWGACYGAEVCGDNNAEGYEECDGVDLQGESCTSQGYDFGTLSCYPYGNPYQCSFDETGCYNYETGSACQDGIDNDGDGDIDCDDSNCVAYPACVTTETSCTNHYDDDGDGDTDCADSDCVNDPYCQTIETFCNDYLDNDADTLIDCADDECENAQCGLYNGSACVSGDCKEVECNDGIDNDYRVLSIQQVSGGDEDTEIQILINELLTGAFSVIEEEIIVNISNNTLITATAEYTFSDDGIDGADSDCEGVPCGEDSVWINGVCTYIEYAPPVAPAPPYVPPIHIDTYVDFLAYLNSGIVYSNTAGTCDSYCNTLNLTCLFADAGMKTCSSTGSTKCTCYVTS